MERDMSETKSAADPSARGKRGQARMRQMAAEDGRDRATLLAELLADHAAKHGRPATASEGVALEIIATGLVRVRRLESQGRSSFEERKQLTQLWRAVGLKAAQPEPKSAADKVADWHASLRQLATKEGA
jgi:hypothetical protein